mgnify:CR=1 FL=1
MEQQISDIIDKASVEFLDDTDLAEYLDIERRMQAPEEIITERDTRRMDTLKKH